MRYELSDYEWSVIKPMLPNKSRGIPRVDDRRILNGIFWILRSGAPWRDLPERYGPWTTVYDRFRRWRNAEVFQKMLNALATQARHRERIDFEFGAVDGSVVRAHKSAAGARKKGLRPKKASKHRP